MADSYEQIKYNARRKAIPGVVLPENQDNWTKTQRRAYEIKLTELIGANGGKDLLRANDQSTDDYDKELQRQAMHGPGVMDGFTNIGGYDNDLGTDGYSPDQSTETISREKERNKLRDETDEEDELRDDGDSKNEERESTEKSPDETNPKSNHEEPKIGEPRGNDGKPINEPGGTPAPKPGNLPTPSGAPVNPPPVGGVGASAGTGVGGGAVAGGGVVAGGAAAEGAVVVGGAAATSEVWLPILLIIVVVLLMLFFIFALSAKFGSKAIENAGGTAVVCLDPGHPPNGAGGEPELNLKVAKEVQEELESRGYTVIMTRKNASAVSISSRPAICNTQGSKEGGAKLFYSFHADGTARSAGYPYQIYPKSSRTKIYSKSKKMAETIQSEVAKSISGVSGLKDGGICAEGSCTALPNLGVFSGSESYGIPAVLTEMAQLSGGGSTLDNAANRRKLVVGIANGIEAVVPRDKGSGDSTTSGNAIVDEAKKHIGKSYVWGATGPNHFDCSGLTQYSYKHGANKSIPRVSRAQYSGAPTKIKKKSDLKPGDLVFFGSPISHVGIYIGKDKTRDGNNVNDAYIHSPSTGDSVKISSLSGRSDFVGGGRY